MVINSDFDITITNVLSANRLRNLPTEAPILRRNRKYWAVALKREGRTCYTVNGRQILSDPTHPVILPKGCSYSWQCLEGGECLILEFDGSQECDHVLSFAISDNSFFVHDFLKLERLLPLTTPETRLEGRQILYGLLLQLIKTAPRDYVPRGKQQLIQPAMDHISAHYYLPDITNDSLARLCGISTVYFRKCFETVCGISPIRFLHNYRTEKAKDILSSDFGSISQVAESVGYSSVYHFSKMFKQYTGLSPSQYVKAARK